MNHIPIIRIEIEGIKQSVAAMLQDRNKELNELIGATFEKQLSEEWVVDKINRAVHECIEKSIESVANNYTLQRAILDLVSDRIAKLIGK